MKRLLFAFCLLFASLSAHAQSAAPALAKQVNAFVDSWHDDAAHARWAYFDKMAPDAVYIGTDKSELWHRDDFKAWAKRYFDAGKAWSFHPIRRNVYASGGMIWFDELLDTQMGVCQASGVVRQTPSGFEIVHYQLSMAVPNEVNKQVVQLIKAHQAGHTAK